MTRVSTDITVIGAGPYGLAISAHLSGRGIRHRVVGRPMRAWSHHMPKGMFLKSEGFASNIGAPGGTHTLAHYCVTHGQPYADQGLPVPLDTFVAYGTWFQRSLVPHLEEVDVDRVSPHGDAFALDLGTGEQVISRRVVVATGNGSFPHVPEVLRGLPDHLVSHPWDHPDLSRLAGLDVTVVGAGQSALESAALLHELGADVRILARGTRLKWLSKPSTPPWPARIRRPLSGLGRGAKYWAYANLPWGFRHLPDDVRVAHLRTALGPAGAWWLRDRVESRVPATTGHELVGATPVDGCVRLRVRGPDGATTDWDTGHVLAATGYRVDLDRMTVLDPSLRARIRTHDRAPVLDARFTTSVPGLHVAGLAAATSFGPVCRFVLGTDFTARRIAGAVVRARGR